MALQGCLKCKELPGGAAGVCFWMSGDSYLFAETGGERSRLEASLSCQEVQIPEMQAALYAAQGCRPRQLAGGSSHLQARLQAHTPLHTPRKTTYGWAPEWLEAVWGEKQSLGTTTTLTPYPPLLQLQGCVV